MRIRTTVLVAFTTVFVALGYAVDQLIGSGVSWLWWGAFPVVLLLAAVTVLGQVADWLTDQVMRLPVIHTLVFGDSDPSGSYLLVFFSRNKQLIVGYSRLDLRFTPQGWIATSDMYNADGSRAGDVEYHGVDLVGKLTGHQQAEFVASYRVKYENVPDGYFGGWHIVLPADRKKWNDLEGSFYSEISPGRLGVRGYRVSRGMDAVEFDNEYRSIVDRNFSGYGLSTFHRFLRRFGATPMSKPTGSISPRVDVASPAYALAWLQYIVSEGGPDRNKLFAAIGQFMSSVAGEFHAGNDQLVLLDIGCGTGLALEAVKLSGVPVGKYIASDCNAELLRVPGVLSSGDTTVIAEDIRDPGALSALKAKCGHVDIILVSRVFNHLDEDIVLHSFRQILKLWPEATLLLAHPAYSGGVDAEADGGDDLAAMLRVPAEPEDFNDVSYDYFARKPEAYRRVLEKVGYSRFLEESVKVRDVKGAPTHFLIAAAP